MKVLILTAMWPTAENPAFGSFVRSQAWQLQQAGIEVDVLVLKGRFRKLIYPKGVLQLRRRLADKSIDLVHAHYGYVGLVARTQFRVPVVVTCHGSDIQGAIDAQGRRTLSSRMAARICLSMGPHVDAVIVQNRRMAGSFTGSNVHVIPCEVDLDIFRPVEKQQARIALGLSEFKKYILFAAHPENRVKRFPLALAAFRRLQASDPAVELLVVCKEPQPRLALYMNACDALVFPSYQEGSPNIVKQAMACNLPIVATDVGDVSNIIGGTDGCYICSPDAEAFASRLADILCQPVRTRGRDKVRHFAGPAVARRLITLYEQVLQKRARLCGAIQVAD